MDKHIRTKRDIAAAIKVVFIFLLTVVCFLFGLTRSISNSADTTVFSRNVGALKAQDLGEHIASLTEAAGAPSTAPAQTPYSAPTTSETASPKSAEESHEALLPLDAINGMYAEYGSIIVEGMKPEDYDAAMDIEWRVLDTPGQPADCAIDLAEPMDYAAYENYVLNLDRYEGVEVSVIGTSEQGRSLYMIRVDFKSEKAIESKPIIIMTGNVHAREFAGADYIVKFLNDTIIKAAGDEYTRTLLENVTIVAVPLVNPDGREMIIEGGSRRRKSNANGVDLNRAMPSVNAGQLGEGVKREKEFLKKPGLAFFAGYSLGSESESQAMIKWLNFYVPKACLYIDLHQQGGITYFDKTFLSDEGDSISKSFAVLTNKLLKKGYPPVKEKKPYGMRGSGGTFTDYARSVSEGLVYSYSLGRMALGMGAKYTPLIYFKDIDGHKEYYKPLNPGFKCICIEIGRSPGYLGAGEKARQRRKAEYTRYGWDSFLTGTIENVLGEEKTASLKLEADMLS